jgi:hypothetical protein
METKIMGLCQSCARSLEKRDSEHNLGTNEDGSLSFEYCEGCFSEGKFTEPDITVIEMIRRYARKLSEEKDLSGIEASEKAYGIIPNLNRWKFFN